MTAVPVQHTEMELFKKCWGCNWSFESILSMRPCNNVDLMLVFEDVWVVAITQTAKCGRFEKKNSLVQYNPGWCRFGVVQIWVLLFNTPTNLITRCPIRTVPHQIRTSQDHPAPTKSPWIYHTLQSGLQPQFTLHLHPRPPMKLGKPAPVIFSEKFH